MCKNIRHLVPYDNNKRYKASFVLKTIEEIGTETAPPTTQLTDKMIESFLRDYKKQFTEGHGEHAN